MTDERIAKARKGCPTCKGGMHVCRRCGASNNDHYQGRPTLCRGTDGPGSAEHNLHDWHDCPECARVLAYGDWREEQGRVAALNEAIKRAHSYGIPGHAVGEGFYALVTELAGLRDAALRHPTTKEPAR